MSAPRRVRRVRLAAPAPELVRRGAVLLEDALRTATVPGADDGRMVLVRRLDVGRIRAGAPPSSLALAVERLLREAGVVAVPAAEASDDSSVVVFRDAGEAAALLAVRLARGEGAGAWFWRAAVPGWSASLSPAEGIRIALRAAAESPPGAAAVASVLRAAMEARVLDRVLASVSPEAASGLMALAGWHPPAPSPAVLDRMEVAASDVAPREWRPVLERWIAAWGGADARSAWLAAIALVDERPARTADPRLIDRASDVVSSVVRSPSRRGIEADGANPVERRTDRTAGEDDDRPRAPASRSSSEDVEPHPDRPDVHAGRGDREERRAGEDDDRRMDASDRREGEDRDRADGWNPRAEDRADAVSGERGRDDPPAASDRRPSSESDPETDRPVASDGRAGEGEPERAPRTERPWMPQTRAAGLFFLVGAMERLGMAACLEAHPSLLEADLPARVLLRVAVRVGIPSDDPVTDSLLEMMGTTKADARHDFAAPAAWAGTVVRPGPTVRRGAATYDAAGRLPIAIGAAATDAVAEAWVAALRRWCRRYARMGLRSLVLRGGRVAFTRTHLDVTMPLSAAEVRVRAAGLDLDPGWVPWLGRVVAFHYTYE